MITSEDIKKQLDKAGKEFYINDLMEFRTGQCWIKKEVFQLTVALPLDCLKKPSIPFKASDFNLRPIVVWIKQ